MEDFLGLGKSFCHLFMNHSAKGSHVLFQIRCYLRMSPSLDSKIFLSFCLFVCLFGGLGEEVLLLQHQINSSVGKGQDQIISINIW